ncbi:MAG: helix-turn-helix domain-containing protein [Chitinispirillales bacterium]|jgi:transcriptional regulator with XRE-family HTH domain|nr:helix-turn-helix domain-containing protein [Chitinispirillales bacterium]
MEQDNCDNKENNENNSVEDIVVNKEKKSIGSILRKQRVSLGLSIEKISSDLRISKNYVKAIEDDDYETIPAEPYIRAYVKTIADFLALDSEKLIEQLSEERSEKVEISPKNYKEDKNIGLKIPLNVSENKKNVSFILVALFVLLLFVLLYFGANKSVLSPSADHHGNSQADSITLVSDEQNPEDLEAISGDDALVLQVPDTIEMQIRVIKDSAWIEIITDGKIFEKGRLIRSMSKIITASAQDSINVRVGNFFATDIQINGKQVEKAGASGVWKFTKDSIKIMSLTEWGNIKRVSQ